VVGSADTRLSEQVAGQQRRTVRDLKRGIDLCRYRINKHLRFRKGINLRRG
jgi:hypothetical protein